MVKDIYQSKVYLMNKEIINTLYSKSKDHNHSIKRICSKDKIICFYNDVKKLLSFSYTCSTYTISDISSSITMIENKLKEILIDVENEEVDKHTKIFISSLPDIYDEMRLTLDAIYNGDPACDSYQEIVLSYPGYDAIISYRIAHFFYKINERLIARIISEEAHKNTGIDISSGCKIGKSFFIDHGTGIVIGETAIIGNNVKLYQGVTLGALSLTKGNRLKGIKRHPTILDNVTIYSNASIFGGDTIIGANSTIGANVYLTSSVSDNSLVYLSDTGIKIVSKG